jgi:Protein of unknown function (DUF2846)
MKVKHFWLCLVTFLISTPRLPAPISEIPAPTSSPRPKHPHQATTARKSDVAPTDVSKKAHEFKSGSDTATVFIYRPAGFSWGMYNGSVITIDGAAVRTMADPRYSVRKLSPGKHVFEATGGIVTHQHIPIAIDLQGNQNYYLRMTIDAWGFPEGKIIFTRASTAQGVEEIAKLTQAP